MGRYLRAPISNGNPREQALIRRWWHEKHGARGRLVWEYYIDGKYADAVWFFRDTVDTVEDSGWKAPERYPLQGTEIVLCEAKSDLTPELIGQALVYTVFAKHAGADVHETVVFAETGSAEMKRAAEELGLTVVLHPLEEV